jgi:hypothetical protein
MKKMRLTILVAIAIVNIIATGCATDRSETSSGTAEVKKITTANGEQLLVVESPSDVASIIKTLSAGKGRDFKLERSQIPADQLKVLDKFAADTTGVADCQTLHVNGCNSCCADNVSSSLRVTTCGNFCDKVCGAEPCH